MFTFKTIKPTGRYKSFDSSQHNIKISKKEVGNIDDEYPFKIRLMVIKDNINEDKNPNCPWKWVVLKKESNSLQEAKDFLNAYFKEITEKYNLYKCD